MDVASTYIAVDWKYLGVNIRIVDDNNTNNDFS